MRISDWSTDVCSADLLRRVEEPRERTADIAQANARADVDDDRVGADRLRRIADAADARAAIVRPQKADHIVLVDAVARHADRRSEEHTSELQSLMRISYAVFCVNKKNNMLLQQISTKTSIAITTCR